MRMDRLGRRFMWRAIAIEHDVKRRIRLCRWRAAGAVLDATNRMLARFIPQSAHSVPVGDLRGPPRVVFLLSVMALRLAFRLQPRLGDPAVYDLEPRAVLPRR